MALIDSMSFDDLLEFEDRHTVSLGLTSEPAPPVGRSTRSAASEVQGQPAETRVRIKAIMSDDQLFIERRPQGDYAVRKPNSERASAIAPTQAAAIEKARELKPGRAPLVERVRSTTVGKLDKWRKA